LLINIELAIRQRIPVIGRISSIPHSYSQSKSETTPSSRRFGIFERKNVSGAA
jgi:hypothetical protein